MPPKPFLFAAKRRRPLQFRFAARASVRWSVMRKDLFKRYYHMKREMQRSFGHAGTGHEQVSFWGAKRTRPAPLYSGYPSREWKNFAALWVRKKRKTATIPLCDCFHDAARALTLRRSFSIGALGYRKRVVSAFGACAEEAADGLRERAA